MKVSQSTSFINCRLWSVAREVRRPRKLPFLGVSHDEHRSSSNCAWFLNHVHRSITWLVINIVKKGMSKKLTTTSPCTPENALYHRWYNVKIHVFTVPTHWVEYRMTRLHCGSMSVDTLTRQGALVVDISWLHASTTSWMHHKLVKKQGYFVGRHVFKITHVILITFRGYFSGAHQPPL